MDLIKIILLVLFGLASLFFLFKLIRDIIWNRKLTKYQKSKEIHIDKTQTNFWFKRAYGLVVSSVFLFVTLISTTTINPQDIIYVNAKSVGSRTVLNSLLKSDSGYGGGWFLTTNNSKDTSEMVESGQIAPESNDRESIDTNNQVDGVDEADIIKTDGNKIFYTARYQNKIRVVNICEHGVASLEKQIDLEDIYTDSLYLTEKYLIVIGYKLTDKPYPYDISGVFNILPYRYSSYTGVITIYDKETLKNIYILETDTNFNQYRLINNNLFLISSKNIRDNDKRPKFVYTDEYLNKKTYLMPYSDIYFFEEYKEKALSVFTSLDLETLEFNSQAFLTSVNVIYANETHLYTTSYFISTSSLMSSFIGYKDETKIMKFQFDFENNKIKYIASGVVDGYIQSQFWMDEYDDHLRVVTTNSSKINRLFTLKNSTNTDELLIRGSITENLGKPNEDVKSVAFQGDTCYVVTFETRDPRYTIDLKDPTNPIITDIVERPGFSSYQHIWSDDGTKGIGFGPSGDNDDNINGIEIVAYNNFEDLDNYQLLYENPLTKEYKYFYSEALYNHKALLISKEYGIFAFPMITYIYNDPNNFFLSEYLIFFINFEAENKEDIISEPVKLSFGANNTYVSIERGVFIKDTGENSFEMVFVFSDDGLISYDITNNEIFQTLLFPND